MALKILLTMSLFTHATFVSAAEPPDSCTPKAVGAYLEKTLGRKWNKGQVRAWDSSGEFWSMPIGNNVAIVDRALTAQTELNCDVTVANLFSFSVRVLPKGQPAPSWDDLVKQSKEPPSKDKEEAPNIISESGTTLGVFEPQKGELILIMYPAKIAAAIARGKGTPVRTDFKDITAKFPAELDIEYNFGGFIVGIFGGTAHLTMREAGDVVFSDLRRNGYQPGPGSEKRIRAFDGFFPPDRHESFWLKDESVLRVELEKIKNGQVRININDNRDRSTGRK